TETKAAIMVRNTSTAIDENTLVARTGYTGEDGFEIGLSASAVLRRGEVTAVYVHTDAGFRLRQIRPGERLPDGRIEILAGLNVGDRVALDPVKASLLRQQNASQQ
nr:hypothetical protein [Denitromonas sp.]